jgi:hypothetical protein
MFAANSATAKTDLIDMRLFPSLRRPRKQTPEHLAMPGRRHWRNGEKDQISADM